MYGQINYSQRLGTGPYTIAEAGCFLTSFSNLLARFGMPVDPPTLNNYFNDHRNYVDVDGDRTMDDLAWGTISAYNGEVVPVQIGGAGWPNSNDAIVKFVYKSPRTNNTVTHFCLVADHVAGTIIDSWDGQVKRSPYGTPVAWARYERHQAQVVSAPAPVTAPAYTVETIQPRTLRLRKDTHLWDLNQRTWPGMVNNPVGNGGIGNTFTSTAIAHHALGGNYYMVDPNMAQGYNTVDCETVEAAPAPVPAPTPVVSSPPLGAMNLPSGKKYTVVVTLNGYMTATLAGNHSGKSVTLTPGEYFVFNTYPGRSDLINITKKDGTPGAWINTADNVVPAPEPDPVPVPESVVQPPVVALQWDKNFHPFNNTEGAHAPVKYVSLADYVVTDFSGVGKPVQLHKYDYIVIAGTFTGPDGKIYGRPQDAVDHSTAEKEYWYGVPMDDTLLEPYDELFSAATTRADRKKLHTETIGDIAADALEEVFKMFGKIKKAFAAVAAGKKKK